VQVEESVYFAVCQEECPFPSATFDGKGEETKQAHFDSIIPDGELSTTCLLMNVDDSPSIVHARSRVENVHLGKQTMRLLFDARRRVKPLAVWTIPASPNKTRKCTVTRRANDSSKQERGQRLLILHGVEVRKVLFMMELLHDEMIVIAANSNCLQTLGDLEASYEQILSLAWTSPGNALSLCKERKWTFILV
jgi:hypothetical protein